MFNFRSSGRRRQGDGAGDEDARQEGFAAGGDDRVVAVTHEASGHAQEVIRAQLADLSQRHLILRQSGETLEALERSVMQLLSDHQRVRLTADGSRSELDSEREQLARLRHEFARLQEEAHGHKQARLQLETSLDTLQHRVQVTGGDLADARRDLASLQGSAGQMRGDLADALARASDAEEKAAFYRSKFEERQNEIATFDAALKKEMQQGAVLTEETRALQDSLEHLNRTLARRDREHAAGELALEQAADRRKELEDALAESDRKHKAAEEELREALEHTRANSGSMRHKLEAMTSRLQVTEQLLAQAREEISARTEELSGVQRQILQITLERNSFEKRTEETRRERDRADRLARETSEINARLAERSHALVASLKNREREYEAAKQKLISLEEELTHAREVMRTSEQQFQVHAAELNSQVAHERSSRQMTDGSLEAARSTIDSLRQEIARLRQVTSGESAGGEAVDGQVRMPVAARLITRDDAGPDREGEVADNAIVDAATDLVPSPGKSGKSAANGAGRKNGGRLPAVVVVKAEEIERPN